MRLALLTSFVVSVLVAATGCSASSQAAQHGTTPADTAGDPSWTPPGQMDFDVGEAKVSQVKNELVNTLPAPNKREIRSNQLHAAK